MKYFGLENDINKMTFFFPLEKTYNSNVKQVKS